MGIHFRLKLSNQCVNYGQVSSSLLNCETTVNCGNNCQSNQRIIFDEDLGHGVREAVNHLVLAKTETNVASSNSLDRLHSPDLFVELSKKVREARERCRARGAA